MSYELSSHPPAETSGSGVVDRVRKLAAAIFGLNSPEKQTAQFIKSQTEGMGQEVGAQMVTSGLALRRKEP